jgi:hypothetical protein
LGGGLFKNKIYKVNKNYFMSIKNDSKEMQKYLRRLLVPRRGVTKQRLYKDPRFALTRQNMAEFATVAKAGRLLRNSIRGFNYQSSSLMNGRLSRLLWAILKTDRINSRGSRSIMNGNEQIFDCFKFNGEAAVYSVLNTFIKSSIDEETGKAVLNVPMMNPKRVFNFLLNTSHFQIDTILVSIDFDQGIFKTDRACSPYLRIAGNTIPAFDLETRVSESRGSILLHCVAVRFYYEVAGKFYLAQAKKFTPVEIFNVSKA